MRRRPILFAALASVALVLGTWAGPVASASADAAPVSLGISTTGAHRGDTVTITTVYTNPEAVPVVFSYMAVVPWVPTLTGNVDYDFTGCTGDIAWCAVVEDGRAAAVQHTVEIAPGATRSASFTFRIADESPCGPTVGIAFRTYNYRESSAGAVDGFSSTVVAAGVSC